MIIMGRGGAGEEGRVVRDRRLRGAICRRRDRAVRSCQCAHRQQLGRRCGDFPGPKIRINLKFRAPVCGGRPRRASPAVGGDYGISGQGVTAPSRSVGVVIRTRRDVLHLVQNPLRVMAATSWPEKYFRPAGTEVYVFRLGRGRLRGRRRLASSTTKRNHSKSPTIYIYIYI